VPVRIVQEVVQEVEQEQVASLWGKKNGLKKG